jgi:hypothetical protein
MENPVEHFDLGFVNYTQHPENPDYVVFRFADVNRANSFRTELQQQKIWFEEANEDKKQVTYTLFGLHKTDYNKAQKINIAVEAKHKKFLIPGKFFRWFVVLFGITMITLAIIGFIKNPNKEGTKSNTEQSNDK